MLAVVRVCVFGRMLDSVVVRPMDVESVRRHRVCLKDEMQPSGLRGNQTATGALMAGWCS